MPKEKPEQADDDAMNTAIKRRRNNSPTDPDNILHVKPGDNSRYVRYAMASWNLPPIDISDPKQVEQRITEYFQHCAENDRKPQLTGMANWLGVDRTTLAAWKRGEYRNDTHYHIIQKAVSALEEMWADYMMNGKVNPASGIFISKNWFGYKNEHKFVVTPEDPLANQNADELRNYLKSLPEIAEDGTDK